MMYVARAKCGCVASALLDEGTDEETGQDLLGWCRQGYTVALEDRTEISAEKCLRHELGLLKRRLKWALNRN